MTEENKSKQKKYVATCRINGKKPQDPPIALAGDPVSFGTGKGQIPTEHKETFINAGQVEAA